MSEKTGDRIQNKKVDLENYLQIKNYLRLLWEFEPILN